MARARGYHSREVVVDDFLGSTRVTEYNSVEVPNELIRAVQNGRLIDAQAIVRGVKPLVTNKKPQLLPAPKPNLVDLIKDGSTISLNQLGKQSNPYKSIDLLVGFVTDGFSDFNNMNPFFAQENGHYHLIYNNKKIASFSNVRDIDDCGNYKIFTARKNGKLQKFIFDGKELLSCDSIDIRHRTHNSLVAIVRKGSQHSLYVNGCEGPRFKHPIDRISIGETKIAYTVRGNNQQVVSYQKGSHKVLGRHRNVISLSVIIDEKNKERVIYAEKQRNNLFFYVDGQRQSPRTQINLDRKQTQLITPNYNGKFHNKK